MHWLELDNSINEESVPDKELFNLWIATTLGGKDGQMTIKIISQEEITHLNNQYRNKNQPTDVLSFPNHEDFADEITPHLPYLGDIVVCPKILKKDAEKLNRNLTQHWAHITIHSVLHLLNYDHQTSENAQEMQELESKIMQDLKLEDPWKL